MIDETDIKNILKNYKVVAIVGVSREIIKYSYIVAEYLKNKVILGIQILMKMLISMTWLLLIFGLPGAVHAGLFRL